MDASYMFKLLHRSKSIENKFFAVVNYSAVYGLASCAMESSKSFLIHCMETIKSFLKSDTMENKAYIRFWINREKT